MRRPIAILAVPAAALAVPAAAAAAGPAWRWPVRGEVVERFAVAGDPYARGQHRGIDVAAPRGAAVRAACAGRVRFAGRVAAFGRAVSVACGGLVVSYGHLGSIATRRGAAVAAGERIGTVGTSGAPSSPTPHLHLGARRAGEPHGYVDPLRFLPTTRPTSPPALPTSRGPGRPGPLTRPSPAGVPAPLTRPSPAGAPVPLTRPSPVGGGFPVVVLAGLALVGASVPGLALVRARRRRGRRGGRPGTQVAFRNSAR